MKKPLTIFAIVVALLLIVPPAMAQQAMPKNAILVGWDGAHRDHVKALLATGKLPNLHKLVAEGKLVDIDVTSGATDTKAGWSQILTGYKPEVTGVYSNGRYRDIPAGYSIFERLRAQYGQQNIATVAVIGKKQHCGEVNAPFKRPFDPEKDAALLPAAKPKPAQKQPDSPNKETPSEKTAQSSGKPSAEQSGKAAPKPAGKPAAKPRPLGRVVEEAGQRFVVFEGSPYYTMHKNVDEWHFGLMLDESVGDKTLELLDKYGRKPFFFFVHFAEVDHAGHRHGEKSAEYDEAIISGDKQLGRIVEKLKQLGVYEKTLIYVTADHGFDIDGKTHRNAPYVFLATNDKQVMRAGTRADIAPTILAQLGVDLQKIAPPLDGEPLTQPATKPIEKPAEGKPRAKPAKARAGAKVASGEEPRLTPDRKQQRREKRKSLQAQLAPA